MVAYALFVAEVIEYHEPSNYREVVSSENSAQWSIAMSEEIESLHKNQTWELVKHLKARRLLVASGSSRKRKELQGLKHRGSRHDWLQRATIEEKV